MVFLFFSYKLYRVHIFLLPRSNVAFYYRAVPVVINYHIISVITVQRLARTTFKANKHSNLHETLRFQYFITNFSLIVTFCYIEKVQRLG